MTVTGNDVVTCLACLFGFFVFVFVLFFAYEYGVLVGKERGKAEANKDSMKSRSNIRLGELLKMKRGGIH